jgi:hypothetical protein
MFQIFPNIEVLDFDVVKLGGDFFFPCRVVGISDSVGGCVSCSYLRMENGFPDVKFGVVVII